MHLFATLIYFTSKTSSVNKYILVIVLVLSFLTGYTQPITIADSAHQYECGLPYDPTRGYSFGQSIYYSNEIQGSGYITALTFYFLGTSLSHSDSITFFIGMTDSNYMDWFFKNSALTKVYDSALVYSTLPGTVTIPLKTPFYYNGVSNLIIAANDLRAGMDSLSRFYAGFFNRRTRVGQGRSRNVWYSQPINPYKLDSLPPNSLPVAGAGFSTANLTIHGLTVFPCQSPKKVNFSNISHNNARVVWTPPTVANTPSAYEVYYSTSRIKPTAASTPSVVNITDTQRVLSSLLSNTMYYVWLRSQCGTSGSSLWTKVDSFLTLCAPVTAPTIAEQFSGGFNPTCWDYANGSLSNPTQFALIDTFLPGIKKWLKKPYLNQPGGTDFSARVGFFDDTLRDWLISPPYNLGTAHNNSLEFDMALTTNGSTSQGFFATDDKFMVVISTDEGLTWRSTNTLQTWAYPDFISNTGQHVIIPLSAYSGIIRIGFYVQSTVTNTAPNLFIDNVKISLSLPVKLLEFTGKKEGTTTLLKWRTATEQNNRGFELQRAPSNSPPAAEGLPPFATLAFVPTKANGGNSTSKLSYAYTDKNPPRRSRGAYYRLKQVDFDGKFTYSNVVFIKEEAVTELALSALFPNPTKQLLNIVLETPAGQKVQIIIADIAGKIVQQQTLELVKGTNNKVMNVAALAKGTYIIKLSPFGGVGGGLAVSKFVKE